MNVRTLVYLGMSLLLASSPVLAGIEYEGERNAFNRFHGKGKFTSGRGEVYEGNWVDGSREGHGVETTPEGERYDGNWSSNLKNGKGKKTWPNGDVYEGEWVAGKMEGQGTFSGKSERYSGGFLNNLRHGKGSLVVGGDKYEGTWKNGRRNGEFKVSLKDGSQVSGHWTDDRAPSSASVELADGIKYTGPVRNGVQPSGKGTCVKAGQSSPCEFRDGKMQAAAVEPPKPEPKPVPKVEPKPAPVVAAVVAVPAVAAAKKAAVEPSKPKDPRTRRGLRADGTQFFFKHTLGGAPAVNDSIPALLVEKDLNEFGAMRISAKGGDFDVTLMLDEYVGEGSYELKYFKGSIQQKGGADYRTSNEQPGKVVILKEEGGRIYGLFSFTGYPNGNVGADKQVVSEGEFVVPAN